MLGAALLSAAPSEATVSCPSLEGTPDVMRRCCDAGSVAIGDGQAAFCLEEIRGGSGDEVRGGSGSASNSETTCSGASELFE